MIRIFFIYADSKGMMGQHISKKRGDGCSARHENANNTVGLRLVRGKKRNLCRIIAKVYCKEVTALLMVEQQYLPHELNKDSIIIGTVIKLPSLMLDSQVLHPKSQRKVKL